MPSMPRTSSKATKIFYSILGKPANMVQSKRRAKGHNTLDVRKRLEQEETRLVR